LICDDKFLYGFKGGPAGPHRSGSGSSEGDGMSERAARLSRTAPSVIQNVSVLRPGPRSRSAPARGCSTCSGSWRRTDTAGG